MIELGYALENQPDLTILTEEENKYIHQLGKTLQIWANLF